MATSRDPLPPREVKILDRNAEALGVSTRTLMANAGHALARETRQRAPDGRILVLCGKANNGGDGLVAARDLSENRDVAVVLAGDPATPLAREALDALPPHVAQHRSEQLSDDEIHEVVASAGTLVDALLGAGIQGTPRGQVARLIELQNEAQAFRVSVDLPTGAGTEVAFVPDVTVALGARKAVSEEAQLGEVVVDIGIPGRAFTHTGPGELALYPTPREDQHKGQGGFVLVIGGGPYTGAPALSAMAAMRAGADLSIALVPEPAWGTVAGYSPNLVARPLKGEHLDFTQPENRVTLNKWLGMVDSVVLGPGLGKRSPVEESVPYAVERVLDQALPVTVDADALWGLAQADVDLEGGQVVLTPHAGEFKILTGRATPSASDVEGRAKVARSAAGSLCATVLLKGPVDVITDGTRVKRNASGVPAMSHGGTGDVLAGVAGAMQAKGLSPFDAARLGAFVTGKAGELAEREAAVGLMATDVVDALPGVFRAHL